MARVRISENDRCKSGETPLERDDCLWSCFETGKNRVKSADGSPECGACCRNVNGRDSTWPIFIARSQWIDSNCAFVKVTVCSIVTVFYYRGYFVRRCRVNTRRCAIRCIHLWSRYSGEKLDRENRRRFDFCYSLFSFLSILVLLLGRVIVDSCMYVLPCTLCA